VPKLATRFALFLLGAAALLCAASAQATDLPPSDPVPVRAVATQPPPKKDREYQLWYYSSKKGWYPANEPKSKKHSDLHKKGKAKGRTHVHPKYWNEDINALANVKNEMLFTVVIDGDMPVPAPTETLPKFCVHYCNNGWIYQTFGSSYQQLYDTEVDTNHLEFRDPSEPCDAPANPVQYFTIGGEGQMLGDGTTCCMAKTAQIPVAYAPCPPVVVCVPEPRKHCLLGGLLRSRRGGSCCGR
jgi:hypothetical protein